MRKSGRRPPNSCPRGMCPGPPNGDVSWHTGSLPVVLTDERATGRRGGRAHSSRRGGSAPALPTGGRARSSRRLRAGVPRRGTTTYECRRGRRWARKSGNHHGFRPIRHVYKQVRWALYKYVFGSFDNVAVTREFGQNTYPDYTWGERLWAGGQAS